VRGGFALTLLLALGNFDMASAEAIYVHAGDLNRLCSSESVVNKSWCEGFISGAMEIIANMPVSGDAACMPPMMTLQKGTAVARRWLANHPETSAGSASLAVARALAEAFPCGK
jgi:hypothetical protein